MVTLLLKLLLFFFRNFEATEIVDEACHKESFWKLNFVDWTPLASFKFILSFQTTISIHLTVKDFSRIQTRFMRMKGEIGDHQTTAPFRTNLDTNYFLLFQTIKPRLRIFFSFSTKKIACLILDVIEISMFLLQKNPAKMLQIWRLDEANWAKKKRQRMLMSQLLLVFNSL